MNVGELIDELSDWDQEAEVMVDGEGTKITLEPGHLNQVVINAVEDRS